MFIEGDGHDLGHGVAGPGSGNFHAGNAGSSVGSDQALGADSAVVVLRDDLVSKSGGGNALNLGIQLEGSCGGVGHFARLALDDVLHDVEFHVFALDCGFLAVGSLIGGNDKDRSRAGLSGGHLAGGIHVDIFVGEPFEGGFHGLIAAGLKELGFQLNSVQILLIEIQILGTADFHSVG